MTKLTIEHMVSDCKMQAMLIPFGYYKNCYISEMKVGDELITIDDPPCHLKVLSINIIPVNSSVTNAISMLIYGYPIESVFDAMLGNCEHAIHKNKLIFIVYEHIYTESFAQISDQDAGSVGGDEWV